MPVFRVFLLAVSLVILPGRTISAYEISNATPAEVAATGAAAMPAEPSSVDPSAGAFASAVDSSLFDLDKPADASPSPFAGAVDSNLFEMAMGAAACAVRAGAVTNPSTLTVIDYSKPSTAKRLWVFDLRSRELLYEEFVAHGQGSGANFATMFSNEPETHRSSLGLFVTDDTYVGRNGYSLRLNGLDSGFNDRARERAIVMHGAPYVNADFVQAQGRLGRSWGCPALREGIARDVIDRVKGGSLVFAYYPDQKWLSSSKYLGDCAAAN